MALACWGVSPTAAQAQADDCPGGVPDNPPGSATIWSEPQCLTPTGDNGEVPQVEIADDGTALAVWRIRDSRTPEKFRVQFSIRKRGVNGGNFSVPPDPPTPPPVGAPQSVIDAYNAALAVYNAALEPTFLSTADQDAGVHLRMDMNRRGDAIVVWEQLGPDNEREIWSAFKPFDGDFGAPQVIMNDPNGTAFGLDSWVDPEVGIDGDGRATVIFHDPPFPHAMIPPGVDSSWYFSKTRSAGAAGVWSAGLEQVREHQVFPGEIPADPQYNEYSAKLKVEESGTRRALLVSEKWGGSISDVDARPGDGRPRIQAAEMGPSATEWTGDGSYDQGADEPHSLQLVKFAGNSLDAFSQNNQLFSTRPTGGALESINEPLAANTPDSGSAFALDNDLTGIALWSTGSLVHANYDGFDDSTNWRAAADSDPIPGNGTGERTRPALAAPYDEDSAVALFQQKVVDDESVWAAVRPPGDQFDRRFDAPVQLSEENDLENEGVDPDGPFTPKRGTGPKVAANGDGEAVAIWSIGDGQTNKVVQVSILVPRPDPDDPDDPDIPDPPAPPPPRPKPAVVSPIQLARSDARDQALVLIANIPGDIRELRWSFGSSNEPPIVGKVEGGELQRTVRLRLRNSEFRAQVEAVTASGNVERYSRTFSPLRTSSSANTKEVVGGLQAAKSPPVFAVGAKDTLTGASDACSPSTVWSGEQKMSGCLKPLEHLSDIPDPEKGAIHELGKELGVDETKRELMDKATQLTDGYLGEGKALLNDKFPVTPGQGASIVNIPQAESLVSAKAELPVGGASYDPKNGFNLKLDPKKVKIPLGKLPKPPKLPSLAGLEIVGDWDVDLDQQVAKIKASVKLPSAIKKSGVQISNEVQLTATPNEVIVDSVRIGPIDVDIASLKVSKFAIQYVREPDEWNGQGKACVIGTACLDMIPPNGGVTIRNGTLYRAGASLDLLPPVPLFTGVNLERIGFQLGLHPTRIGGSARVGVGELIKLDGRIFVAFPDSQEPFVFDRKDVGDAYPARFYGRVSTTPTFGASAEAFLKVPVIGETKLGSAYVLYEYPSYAAFGGQYHADILDLVSVSGGVDAEADFAEGLFNVHGSVRACLHIIDDICEGAVGNVSRGRGGTGGAGACVEFAGLNIGGGVQWQRLSEPFIWPFDGCKWSRFTAVVRSSAVRASQAGGPYTIKVEKGKPSPALQLDGVGGAPTVRVRGPGGQVLEAPAGKGFAFSPDKTIRILRFDGQAAKMTIVGLQNAQPGTYTVETLPGSAAVAGVKQTTDPPDASASGRVTGKGRVRVLHYDVGARQDQRVVFEEVTPKGASKRIGTTTKAHGTLRFRSAPGRGRRRVFAQFELSGVPAERKLVTSFTPQSPILAKPKRIRVRRRGSGVRVSWRKVKGATSYEVAAQLSSRRMVFAKTRRTRVTLKRVPRYVTGRITVRALDDLRQSKVARSKRFKATGRRPSPFRRLLDCKLRRRTITCTKPKQRCGGLVPTITSARGHRTRGTKGNDVIIGTAGGDRIDGRGGNDVICAAGGNDRVTGGSGNDRITGRTGNDTIDGGTGNDRIKGGKNNDHLIGGLGADRIIGGAGRGRDRIDAGPGNDRIETRDDGPLDQVNCGPGRDSAKEDRRDHRQDCERVFIPRLGLVSGNR